MASASNLRIRKSLVWETKILSGGKWSISSNFTLMNSEWNLRMCFPVNETGYYEIVLRQIFSQPFQPFQVISFLEHRRNDDLLYCSKLIISTASEVLYKVIYGRLFKKFPEIQTYRDLAVVCVFWPTTDLALCEKTENDFKETAQCSQSRNAGNDSNPSTSLEFLPGFESLSEDLSHLLDESLMADIQLKSGGELIPANRIILASRSEVFSAMLRHQMAESESSIIDIKDIEPSVLRPFLRYLYSGKMPENLPEEIICKLYTVSDKYAVCALQKLCLRYMTRNLNKENFTKILMLAETHSDKELKESAAAFITGKTWVIDDRYLDIFSENFPKLANEMYGKCMKKMLSK